VSFLSPLYSTHHLRFLALRFTRACTGFMALDTMAMAASVRCFPARSDPACAEDFGAHIAMENLNCACIPALAIAVHAWANVVIFSRPMVPRLVAAALGRCPARRSMRPDATIGDNAKTSAPWRTRRSMAVDWLRLRIFVTVESSQAEGSSTPSCAALAARPELAG
jgi:hypothetical protein